MTDRDRKFRHAAWVYLHVGILYEAAAFSMVGEGLLPTRFGPPWVWLVGGAIVALGIFAALLKWKNRWFARAVWAVNGLRLPTLISGAFFPDPGSRIEPSFYVTALVIVIINMAFLARAGWDL